MLAITLCPFLLLQHCSTFPISYSVSRTAAIYQNSHRKTYRHYAAAAGKNSSDSFQRARLANQLQLQQQGNSDTNDAEDRWVAGSSGSANGRQAAINNNSNKQTFTKQILLLLGHPINFCIVILFHILGVHQASLFLLSKLPPSAATSSGNDYSLLIPLLMQPSICVVLLSLILITSMVTSSNNSDNNVYYVNDEEQMDVNEGDFLISKSTFDTYLYAILLLLSSSISGNIPRIMVSMSSILTYLYTTHLRSKLNNSATKNKWIINLGSAILYTLTPLVSGLAACHVLRDASFLSKRGIFIGGALDTDGLVTTLQSLPFELLFKSPLGFLIVAMFGTILGREIVMDLINNSSEDDTGNETNPTVGKKSSNSLSSATKQTMVSVALGCTILTSIAACSSSIIPFYNIIMALITDCESRKAVLSVWGSVMLIWRAWRVWTTSGKDVNLAKRTVGREGMVYAMMILASFL